MNMSEVKRPKKPVLHERYHHLDPPDNKGNNLAIDIDILRGGDDQEDKHVEAE